MSRPPLPWLTPPQIRELAPNTALAVETHGRHAARPVGRLVVFTDDELVLDVGGDEPEAIPALRVKRARVVAGLFDAGDPVLQRGVDAATWRGGVVSTSGTDVLVEDITGAFSWLPESDLEPAAARDPRPATVGAL